MDDLLSEFLTETNKGLAVLDVELVKLEQNPNDMDLLSNIFRLMHTIKGTCGFLGLPRLEAVAHAGENVLGKVREGEAVITPVAVSMILECLDRIRLILMTLEQTEAEPEGDDRELIDRLNGWVEGGDAQAVPQAEDHSATQVKSGEDGAEVQGEASGVEEPDEAFVAAEASVPAEPCAAEPAPPAAPIGSAPAAKDAADAGSGKSSSLANQSIRVNVDLLENLMTMVSELVLTRNQLLQILRSNKESDFAAPLQRLNHVVSDLQEGVMKTRMQPIGNAWAKLPRIIRDLSIELDKKIDLVMKGAETELDRQVLELIKDPLTHMVRNSADHGLETKAQRAQTNKPEVGKVILNAYHQGGHIIIEISDDGRGLSVEKIRAKVIENGLASEAELESMSEQQIQRFIFKPGFSTAAEVTAVSGRGVGMDVVRTNIEKIGGTIDLTYVEGRGTTFTIKIPLTLAIVSALIVECAGEQFAIPQISVVELVRTSSHTEHRIERINDTPVLRLRNRLLPLVSLRNLLALDQAPAVDSAAEAATAEGADVPADHFVVVTQVGNYNFGIIVDRVFDTEEIVVKPVAWILRDVRMFSGNTILGDGSVVMILDPNGIAAATGEIDLAEDAMDESDEGKARSRDETIAMLVFRTADKAPKTVPLSLIARLEEINLADVEFSNGHYVVQYRGQLMPLVLMDEGKSLEGKGRQPVLVFTERDHAMGLVVDEIVDIVDTHLDIELASERQELIGSAVIGERTTDVVDISHYLARASSAWFGDNDNRSHGEKLSRRLLLIDDSPFFRDLLSPLLQVAGYDVTAVDSAEAALELCNAGLRFDLIISDIEMPGMDGFTFAEKVRGETRWSNTPLVALSAFTSEQDLARGRDAGFRDYVAKSDRDGLLQTIEEILNDLRGAA